MGNLDYNGEIAVDLHKGISPFTKISFWIFVAIRMFSSKAMGDNDTA